MANATKPVAPEKEKAKIGKLEDEYINMEFDPDKRYVFQLAEENRQRGALIWDMRENRQVPERKFRPFHNIVYTSQIVWNKQRRNIRYYDGCTSLFVEEQPKDKEAIDQLIRSTRRRNFEHGMIAVYGDERMLLLYLMICSWNVESPFRTRTANQIFRPLDENRKATQEAARLDKIDEAMGLAKDASEIKMRIHANYLDIPTIDEMTGNELSEKALKTEYRKYAINNPEKFIESYGDKTIELKYYIDKAIQQGIINYTTTPNKATWQNGNVICDISGLRSAEGAAAKLLELSQLEEGEEFVLQLKAIFK